MPARVGFDIRSRSAWRDRSRSEGSEDRFLVIEEETEAPPRPPRAPMPPAPRHRRAQVGLVIAAGFLLLFILLGDPVEATMYSPFGTEASAEHHGTTAASEQTVFWIEVDQVTSSAVQFTRSGDRIQIGWPAHRDDLGLRIRDLTLSYADTVRVTTPGGAAKTAWEDSSASEMTARYYPGIVPLQTGLYSVAWSSSCSGCSSSFAVDVVRLEEEKVFDSDAFFAKVYLAAGALLCAVAALVLHFRAPLGRLGGVALDEASAVWDRLRRRVDR